MGRLPEQAARAIITTDAFCAKHREVAITHKQREEIL